MRIKPLQREPSVFAHNPLLAGLCLDVGTDFDALFSYRSMLTRSWTLGDELNDPRHRIRIAFATPGIGRRRDARLNRRAGFG